MAESSAAAVGDGPPVLWAPDAEAIAAAPITAFARWVQDTRAVRVTESYNQLWQWSVGDLEGFWAAVWEYFDVQAAAPHGPVLRRSGMPGAQWFPGTRLNYA
jgi:acetoacetyl-CoA synthetase